MRVRQRQWLSSNGWPMECNRQRQSSRARIGHTNKGVRAHKRTHEKTRRSSISGHVMSHTLIRNGNNILTYTKTMEKIYICVWFAFLCRSLSLCPSVKWRCVWSKKNQSIFQWCELLMLVPSWASFFFLHHLLRQLSHSRSLNEITTKRNTVRLCARITDDKQRMAHFICDQLSKQQQQLQASCVVYYSELRAGQWMLRDKTKTANGNYQLSGQQNRKWKEREKEKKTF